MTTQNRHFIFGNTLLGSFGLILLGTEYTRINFSTQRPCYISMHTNTHTRKWSQRKKGTNPFLFASLYFRFPWNAPYLLNDCQSVFAVWSSFFLVFLFDFFFLILHFSILFVIFFDSIDYFRFCCFPTKIIHYERDKKRKKKNCCRWNSICEYHSNMHFFHIRAHPVPFVLARSLLASFAYFVPPHNMWTISIKIMNKWNKDLCFFLTLTLTVYAFVKDITITKSF